MRKIYAFALSAFMALPMAVSAQTMTEENAVLENMGFRLEKDVNFRDGYVNGQEIVPNNGLQWGNKEDYKINQQDVTRVANEGLEFLGINVAGNGIDLVNGKGLRSTKNERWIVVNDLLVGQIVALDISNTDTVQFVVNSHTCNSKSNWEDVMVDPLIVEPISGKIHKIQEVAEDMEIDTYRYFKVINEGPMYAKFNGKKENVIYRMQIWTNKDEAEAVTAPSLRMAMVDGTTRGIEFKPGKSTMGSACTTWWGVVEQGESALYLEDTEEVDHIEYTYQLDEEGNQVLDEEGNPIILSEEVIYKKKLVPVEGAYGDREFNAADGYAIVDDGDDVDGDGFVTIAAATVSETGAFSSISTLQVAVGEVQLNGPTLTLSDMNEDVRIYKLGWSNNTLCGEDYKFRVLIDDEFEYELEPKQGIGSTYEARNSIKVTVEVDGYLSGETILDELELEGITVSKKAEVGNNESEAHNWDFATLSEATLDKLNGKIVERYEVLDEEDNVIATYTPEQVEAGEVLDEHMDILIAVPVRYGWDGADSRNTQRHWRSFIINYYVNEAGETTDSVVSTGYVDDTTGLFEGLVVDAPHASYSALALYKDGQGLYYMTKGTIEIADVKYGEYVAVSTNDGSTVTMCENPAGGFTINVGSGKYVKYIDIFTYDNLPDDIKNIQDAKVNGNVYSIDGRIVSRKASLDGLQKGLYIMNGKKYMVK